MSRGSIGRIIFAVVAGYAANAILVVAMEQLFSWLVPSVGTAPTLHYYVADVLPNAFATSSQDTCVA